MASQIEPLRSSQTSPWRRTGQLVIFLEILCNASALPSIKSHTTTGVLAGELHSIQRRQPRHRRQSEAACAKPEDPPPHAPTCDQYTCVDSWATVPSQARTRPFTRNVNQTCTSLRTRLSEKSRASGNSAAGVTDCAPHQARRHWKGRRVGQRWLGEVVNLLTARWMAVVSQSVQSDT